MKRLIAILTIGIGLALASAASGQTYRGVHIAGNWVPVAVPSGRSDMMAIEWGAGVPSGTCSAPSIYIKSDGAIYGCNAGTWSALSATSTTPTFTTVTTTGAVSSGTTVSATTTVTGTTGVISATAKWTSGAGVPAASCAGGDLYTRTDGSTNTTLYVCTALNTWTAK